MGLLYYLGLLKHRTRIEAFRRGIEAEVGPEDRVLDLGCGLGTFAFFAARAGAGRVVAVDGDPVVHVARSVARVNGLDDRIDFVRGRLPETEVTGPFDVLVFEDFPRRFLDARTHRMLRRVREELLADAARVVPRAARLVLAPVQAPPGDAAPRDLTLYGIDFTAVRPYAANEPQPASLPDDVLLAAPATGPKLPVLPPPDASDLTVSGSWGLEPGTRVDALLLWFELEAAPGEWISNAPGPDAGPWGQVVLSLEPALQVEEDGTLEAEVRREPSEDGAPGWLAWRAESGGREIRGHEFAAYPAALGDVLAPDETASSGVTGDAGPDRDGRKGR